MIDLLSGVPPLRPDRAELAPLAAMTVRASYPRKLNRR